MTTQQIENPAACACRKCGASFAPKPWQITSRDIRCLPCKRRDQNTLNRSRDDRENHRAAYQRRKNYWREYIKARKSDPEYIQKRAARRKVATEIEAGRLRRMPCQQCGTEKADAHHTDYAKPLEIEWLCRSCHITHEKLKLRSET